jgi:hypothetical protein
MQGRGRGNVAAERLCGALFVGLTALKGYFYTNLGGTQLRRLDALTRDRSAKDWRDSGGLRELKVVSGTDGHDFSHIGRVATFTVEIGKHRRRAPRRGDSGDWRWSFQGSRHRRLTPEISRSPRRTSTFQTPSRY